MDGPFYLDSRSPFTAADIASVTLATTDKALYPVANFPVLGSNYFSFVGKKIKIRLFGRMTTAATPGNGTMSVYFNNGGDANLGTLLQSSAAIALAANRTSEAWRAELDIVCRAFGASGALLCTGMIFYKSTLITTAADQPAMIPTPTPAQVTVDLTVANIISVQYKRSGSTAEAMQVH